MKNLSLILALILFLCANSLIAGEGGNKYNLTTPDNTVQSFFKAAKEGDVVGLEKMISPRIKEMLAQKQFSIKGYAKAWTSYPIAKIDKAKQVNFENDPRELASVDIIIMVNGKEHQSHVSLIKMNGQWLWNEK